MTAARRVVPMMSVTMNTGNGIRRQPFAAYIAAVGSGSHGAGITGTPLRFPARRSGSRTLSVALTLDV